MCDSLATNHLLRRYDVIIAFDRQVDVLVNTILLNTEKYLINTVKDQHYTFPQIWAPIFINKLKSLKVAQVKDEMDDDEDEGCESVCDVAW